MFSNKTVIITGASSGIGEASAKFFISQGANVVLAARNIEKLDNLCQTLGAKAIAVQADVCIENDCKLIIDKAIEKFKGIDILINNAGISMRALFKDTEVSVLKQLMDVNFWGMVYCTKFALPYILSSKGSIVSISSIAGWRGLPGRTGYSASKFAMQGFMEALRTENIHTGIQVLTICPGFTASNIRNTALNNEGKQQGESPRDESSMMTSEEVAMHIAKAIQARKKTLILTTQGKFTVLLNKFFPSFMDNIVYNHMAKEKDSPFK